MTATNIDRAITGLRQPRGGNAPSRVATPAELEDFDGNELAKGYVLTPMRCGKCGGTGRYWGPGGGCFECNGKGKVVGRVYSPDKRQTLDEAAEDRANRKKEKAAAERAAVKGESLRKYPDAHKVSAVIMDEVDAHGRGPIEEKYGSFIVDVALKGEQYGFTVNQATSLVSAFEKRQKINEERQQEAETLTPAVDGRQTVRGEVIHVVLRDTMYGQTWKMIVMDDRRFKVWSTIPSAIVKACPAPLEETLKGKRVEYDGTLEVSRDDVSFSFASRPTNARVL